MRAAASRKKAMETSSQQASKLLPALFEGVNEEQKLNVLHVGPALQDTLDFFSGYRCKLHIRDLFTELPIIVEDDCPPDFDQQFEQMLQLPPETQIDICLFWDFFNYLSAPAVDAFLRQLHPYLHPSCRGHAFSVHNLRSPRSNNLYGIREANALCLKPRPAAMPGYAPQSQRELKELLHCFNIERSVLLPDSRLELLLQRKIRN